MAWPPRENVTLHDDDPGWTEWEYLRTGATAAPPNVLNHITTTSGVYEQAVLITKSSTITAQSLIVVYVGQAKNLQDRLKTYARNGSHLKRLHLAALHQYPAIMVRYHTTQDAKQTETRLLQSYDYAWNIDQNHKAAARCFGKKNAGPLDIAPIDDTHLNISHCGNELATVTYKRRTLRKNVKVTLEMIDPMEIGTIGDITAAVYRYFLRDVANEGKPLSCPLPRKFAKAVK